MISLRFAGFSLTLLAVSGTVSAQSLDTLTQPHPGRSMRATSGNDLDNSDSEKFTAGETRTIARFRGPGKIAHIWLTPNSIDIRHPRAFVLRAYWDGADVPSVEVPLGDFFAVGNGMRANVNSLPVKVSSYGRGYNCYWQMPFKREARITLTNDSKNAASCYFQIDWVKLDEAPEPTMYFHARYHQEYHPQLGKPYTAFVGKGNGHYVGTVLSSQNAVGHWFGEGDDMFYIDGEKTPSLQGTGTEDYINGQRRERKIGLFQFEPGEHTIRFVCVGSNPSSAHPATGKLRYNLSADVISARRLPFDDQSEWIERAIELEKPR